jgi:hypothetical protein
MFSFAFFVVQAGTLFAATERNYITISQSAYIGRSSYLRGVIKPRESLGLNPRFLCVAVRSFNFPHLGRYRVRAGWKTLEIERFLSLLSGRYKAWARLKYAFNQTCYVYFLMWF